VLFFYIIKILMTNPSRYPSIAIANGSEISFYWPKDIVYCKSEGNYTTVFLLGGEKVTTAKKLKDLESTLPHDRFIRVHHSFVINLTHVKKFLNDERKLAVMTDGMEIQVSRRRKSEFLGRFIKL